MMFQNIIEWMMARPKATGATGISSSIVSLFASAANHTGFWVSFDTWVLRAASVGGLCVTLLTAVVLTMTIITKHRESKKQK